MLKKTNRLLFNSFLLLVILFAGFLYWNVLSAVLASIVFAFVLNPAVSWIESYGYSRTLSIVVIYLVIAIILATSMLVVLPRIFSQGEDIFSYLRESHEINSPKAKKDFEEKIRDKDKLPPERVINIHLHNDETTDKWTLSADGTLTKDTAIIDTVRQVESLSLTKADSTYQKSMERLAKYPLIAQLNNLIEDIDERIVFVDLRYEIRNAFDRLKQQIIEVPAILLVNLEKLASMFAFIFMIPFISFFILNDMNIFIKMGNRFIPNRIFELFLTITHKINELVSSFLRALLIEVLIVGILSSIVLTIIGVNYSILIGFLAGLANMVPYFGPFFGVLFAIVSVILSGQDLGMIIYVIFGMWGVQVLDNNIVYPIVIGKNTNMHPLHVFLTVVAGGYLFGILGMIISVPLVYIITEITKELYSSLKKYDII